MLTMIFSFCALVGSAIYALLIVLMFLGMIDLDFDGGLDDVSEGDTDGMFKFLSIKVLAAFTMMFGLIGLATYQQLHWNAIVSIVLAFAAGIAMVKLTDIVGRQFMKLESSGDNSLQSFVGHTGVITVTVDGQRGSGAVNATKPGSQMEFGCVSQDGSTIQRGTQVQVTSVQGNKLVVQAS